MTSSTINTKEIKKKIYLSKNKKILLELIEKEKEKEKKNGND